MKQIPDREIRQCGRCRCRNRRVDPIVREKQQSIHEPQPGQENRYGSSANGNELHQPLLTRGSDRLAIPGIAIGAIVILVLVVVR